MFARFRSSRLAWLLALLLVFSQLVTAAYACVDVLPVQPAPMSTMMGMSDCSEMQQVEQPVVCKAHCQKDSQSADIKIPSVAAPVFVALFFATPYVDAATASAPVPRREPPTLAASPPLRVQFQVFRN
ncbi:hypothetical protein [Jeongeupia sp. USM3]|uniref:hypothetical protein n=1 Tax=Jeongeupia sp. USM3 TaxID=1906741 RepID=UPI00089DEE66|nr:hypothetical protein [Jeongeupia sp. USM3]AOX99045.1 hypothetical protein BJP62_00410 [Jeongeupia sp. USM3]